MDGVVEFDSPAGSTRMSTAQVDGMPSRLFVADLIVVPVVLAGAAGTGLVSHCCSIEGRATISFGLLLQRLLAMIISMKCSAGRQGPHSGSSAPGAYCEASDSEAVRSQDPLIRDLAKLDSTGFGCPIGSDRPEFVSNPECYQWHRAIPTAPASFAGVPAFTVTIHLCQAVRVVDGVIVRMGASPPTSVPRQRQQISLENRSASFPPSSRRVPWFLP